MTVPDLPSFRRLSASLASAWPGFGWAAWRQRAAYGWVGRVVWLFVVTRLGIMIAAYLGWFLLPEAVDPPTYHLRGLDNVLVDIFGSRWDTGFYVSIVEEGYVYEGVPFPSVAFFPLLPLLMRLALPLTGDALLSGLLVSNAALLAAALLFYRIVNDQWG